MRMAKKSPTHLRDSGLSPIATWRPKRPGSGLGLAYVPEELITDDLAQGTLIRVLQRYSQRLEGSFLYYPHRNVSPALRAVIDTLRMWPKGRLDRVLNCGKRYLYPH